MEEQSGGTSKVLHSHRHSKSALRIESPADSPPQELTFEEQSRQCPEHREDLLFCCFDCKDMLCCARCVAIGKHRNHDVKNLHRSYVLVETSLSEFLIRLGAKIDLYSLYHEKLAISKSETIEDFGEVQRRIAAEFKTLADQLDLKKKELLAVIDAQASLREHEFDNLLADLRSSIKLCLQSHSMIERHIKELSEVSLCKFYSEKKDFIEGLLAEHTRLDSPQQPRQQLNVQVERLQTVLLAIKELKLNCLNVYHRKRVGRGSVDMRISTNNFTYEQKKYKQKETRQPRQSLAGSPTRTPAPNQPQQAATVKHSKVREVECKQSRKTLKMFSMPSSPLKDKRQSPLHYLELQKRSFILGKKNC